MEGATYNRVFYAFYGFNTSIDVVIDVFNPQPVEHVENSYIISRDCSAVCSNAICVDMNTGYTSVEILCICTKLFGGGLHV